MLLTGNARELRRLLILHFGFGVSTAPVHIPVLHLCILPFLPRFDELPHVLLESSLNITGLHYLVDELYLDVRSCGAQHLSTFFVKWNPRIFSMSTTDIATVDMQFPKTVDLRLELVHMPTFGAGAYDPICRVVSHCLSQKERKLSCVRISSHMLLPGDVLHTNFFDEITALCTEFNIELSFRCPFRRWTFDGLFEDVLKNKSPCDRCRGHKLFVSPFVTDAKMESASGRTLYSPFYFEKLCYGRPSTLVASYWSGYSAPFPVTTTSTDSSLIVLP